MVVVENEDVWMRVYGSEMRGPHECAYTHNISTIIVVSLLSIHVYTYEKQYSTCPVYLQDQLLM